MSKGRPREFEIPIALEQALKVFWQKGYRGTSLDDLTDSMGINRPSLYAAFGDKENLFLQTVQHYRKSYLRPHFVKLLQADNLRTGLPEYLQGLLSVIDGETNPPGCLIACLLTEESCDSTVIRSALAQSIAEADKALKQVFERHQSELSPHLNPEEAAQLLITTVHGVAIRARSGADRQTLANIENAFTKLVLKDTL